MKTNQQSGMTLIELMMTLLIAGIVMVIAVPNMNQFIKNERLTGFTNSFLLDLMLARSKAVELNTPVIVCASNDEETCSGGDYDQGWIVVTAPDGNINDGEILKIQQELTAGISVALNDGALSTITYDSRGFTPDIPAGAIISLCDDRGDDYARALTISPTGRVSRGADPSC